MNNAKAPGALLELTAPSGGVVSGQPYQIGSLVVVAAETKAQTLKFNGATKGVFILPRPQNEAWTVGLKLYFDASEGLVTLDSDTGSNPLIGVAVAALPATLVLATDASGGDLDIAGNVITVGGYAALSGVTVTLTIKGGTPIVLTEGDDFDAETSDEVTATNLGAAIDALSGLTATVDGDEVTVAVADPYDRGHVRLDGAAR